MNRSDHAAVALNRRQFIVAGVSTAGAMVLGLPVAAAAQDGDRRLGYFVEIRPDGRILIGSNQPEIGQGVRTALPMLVAEELDADWQSIEVTSMPLGLVRTDDGFTWKYGGQGVGGSTGLTSNFDFMREIGARARQRLILAAAQRLEVSPDTCRTEPGVVICDDPSTRLTYADLATSAAGLTLPDDEPAPALKDPSDYRIVGHKQTTVQARDIVTGRMRYGIDTQMPDMRYAVIARSPWLNGRPKRFDDAAARRVKGVLDVFEIEGPKMGEPYQILASGVAVVADSTWAAIKGRDALKVEWDKGPSTGDSSEAFWRDNARMLETEGQICVDDGDYASAWAAADTRIVRRYEVPFVSHAPLEPQNCFANVTDERCHIIAPTQTPSGASRSAAWATGLERDRIHVDFTRVGGGFGRRLTNDYVAEAALIAKRTGWPIKLQWTREDDMRNDFYRPAGTHELRAGLGQDGEVTAWAHRLASASKYYRRPNMPDDKLWGAELYADDFPRRIVENLQLEYHHNTIGVPRGSWRAPAHTANAFVVQSFIDEIAHETGQDPLALRLTMFGNDRELEYGNHGGPTFNPGRLTRLTKFVAERIDYARQRPSRSGVGLAAHFTFGGYAAHAIEVTVSKDGALSIDRIVAAIDCGFAVHPNAVEAQLQGGTVDGLSTALGLEITVRDGQIQQSNFHDYPLAKIAAFPARFEAHILDYDQSPTGVGEMGIPSAAPALTNAIFAATGKRIRRLPLGDQLRADS
ncbi:MAG: molybdopterin cofactor-binding domain-containing protein [Pseudomonadota bacterium]